MGSEQVGDRSGSGEDMEGRTGRREGMGREQVGDTSGSAEDMEWREQAEERTVRRGHVERTGRREDRGRGQIGDSSGRGKDREGKNRKERTYGEGRESREHVGEREERR